MQLTIDGRTYDVDAAPVRERVNTGLAAMITGSDKNPALKGMVKAACQFAMGILGLKKQDRNDDVILIVAKHVTDQLFTALEKQGLALQGTEVTPKEAEAVVSPKS